MITIKKVYQYTCDKCRHKWSSNKKHTAAKCENCNEVQNVEAERDGMPGGYIAMKNGV